MDREDRTMETVASHRPQEDGDFELDGESAVRIIDRSGRAACETSAPREAAEEDGQSLIVDEGVVVPSEFAFVADTSHRFAIAFRENEMIRARKYPQPSHSSNSLAADDETPGRKADGAGAPPAAKLTKPRVARTRSGRAVRSKVRLSTSVSEPDERPEQPARTPTKRFSRPRAERAPSPCEDDPPAAAEDRRRSGSGAAQPAPPGEGARVPPLESAAAPAAPPAAPPVPRRSWTPWAGGRGKGLLPRVLVRMDEHGAPRTLALLATSLSVRSEADRRQSRYPCIVCERPQRSKTSLRAHLVSHTGERPFQCSACPAAFRHFANARGHLRRHTAARCACDVCGRTFLLRADLRRHQRTHSQRPKLACHLCPSTFSRADNLARHVRVAHGAEPPPTHRCDLCQKEFKTEAWLKQHMTIHKAAREHVCAQCGRKFALRSYLERHLKSHGQTRVYCDLCPRRFINIKNLTVHRQTFHRNPVPLSAEEQRRAAEPRPEPARRSPSPPPAGVRPRRISLEIVRSRRPPRRLLQETEREEEREDGESEESGGSDEEWTPDRR
ncbi:zinc finger protein 668-like [Amphibalanus amphitrite]|uniref:zinc finger protein 668-like n=1 Tax=Amphibalanus amphitrite TaxID=1232801 RepID=UPI001C903DD6|nr:zinc finger protein 668-like [Amphibalanus amphitrite]